MKKKFLKLFVKGTSIVLLSWGVFSYGCADGWWGSYNSVFSPEATVSNSSYTPFFYDAENLFYSGDARSSQEVFQNENIKDWKSYLGNSVSDEVISFYLYDESVASSLNKWVKDIQSNKTPNLPHKLDVKNDKIKNFFTFLSVARGTENITNQTYDYWDYDNRTQLKMESSKISSLEKVYNEIPSTDAFYKNRMWFQIMRLKFYSDNVKNAISFFNQTEKDQPKNTLYYRALHYVAGANKSQGNYDQSNSILARLFDEFPLLQHAAIFEYRSMTDKEVSKLAKSLPASQQSALWAMQGYYGDAMKSMKEIYAIQPSSKHIDFLLSRYVNILENEVNIYANTWEPTDMKSVTEYRKQMKKNLNASDVEWIQKVAKEGKVSNPFIWNTASGYVASMSADFSKATDFYTAAKSTAKTKSQKDQLRLLNVMNEVAKTDKMDANAEQRLLEDLKWLQNDASNGPYGDTEEMRYSYATTWTKQYISMLYKQQKDNVLSELVFSRKGFYKDQKQSEAMEQFFLKRNKSSWEKLWEGIYEYNLADIYESRAIYLFYQNKIDEAIVEFEKVPVVQTREYNWDTNQYETKNVDYKEITLPGNPFNGKIKDCNDCDHQAKQSVKYTSLTFMKKIKEMQAKVEAGEDVYNNALLIGNAFYNASYFGNARSFYYNSIVNEYGNSIGNEHQNILLSMQWVKKYYDIAQKAATTKEEKAKMAYMLAKVERNDFYNNNYFMKAEGYWGYADVMFKKWKGFEELKTQYSDTKYYKDVIAECGYFRKYLGLQ